MVDYDQTSLCSLNSNNNNNKVAQMSTFNHVANNNNNNIPASPSNKTNNNLILMMLKQQQQQQQQQQQNNSSPLTPRQIKQRNTAKRNSIPRSSSSNQLTTASTTTGSTSSVILNTNQSLTPQQQSDLSFLQTQKFEKDFIQTTKDLFARYPNAKISISVTVSQIQNGTSQQPTVVQTQSTRQIEIDRLMFDKICTFQQIQPLSKNEKKQIFVFEFLKKLNCNKMKIKAFKIKFIV